MSDKTNVTNNMANLVNEQINNCRLATRMASEEFDNELSRLEKMVKIYKECDDISSSSYRWAIERNDKIEKEKADRLADATTKMISLVVGTFVPSVVNYEMFSAGLEFETTGTVTSTFFKNFINRKIN